MDSEKAKKLLLSLAPQQLEVVKRVCKGYGYKAVGEDMFISLSSVKGHMAAVYKKLELSDFSTDDRKFQLRLIYCPLLKELAELLPQERSDLDTKSEMESASIAPEEDEIIDVSQETELKPITKEETTDGSEEKKITYIPKPKSGGKEKMDSGKGHKRIKLVLLLIVAALLVFGGWQGLKWIGGIPLGLSGNTYEIGDWVKQDDVWVRISEYEVTGTKVALFIEVWNKTGHEYFFSWDDNVNFSMVDNKNNEYDVLGSYERKVNLDTDERMRILGQNVGTVGFKNDPIYQSGVTDLYVEMEYFATIDKAVFHIDLND